MQSLGHDVRYAVRTLLKSPGFSAVAVLTLALGIGAITMVFTWANAILMNPWPQVRAARELRFFAATVKAGGGYSLHYDEYQYLRDHSRSFREFTAHELLPVDLAGSRERPERYSSGVVGANYFAMLGVKPELGRGFAQHDDRAYGSAPEVVLKRLAVALTLPRRSCNRRADNPAQPTCADGGRYCATGICGNLWRIRRVAVGAPFKPAAAGVS